MLTDIIIPTYQNEDLTVACFESIKKHTEKGTYLIIWVDNGSKSTKKARKALEGVDHVFIPLKENIGFVGAINEGLSMSTAPTVCLLNNDTEVSEGWLTKLNATLYRYEKLGIVGPLTGPPAQVQQYDSHHNIVWVQNSGKAPKLPEYTSLADFNKQIEKQFRGKVTSTDFVAFLCACIKREVIDKVGYLDTGYEMGMWDDCDYNMAAKKAGYSVALCLDTCIVHKGRSTFKIIQEQEGFDVDALLSKNRLYLDRKWGL